MAKNPPAAAGDIKNLRPIPGSGGPLGGGHDNPLHYSCLDNFMDRRPGQKELDMTEVA